MENDTYSDLLEKAYAGNVDAAYRLLEIMASYLGTHAEALRQLGDSVPLTARIPTALCEYFENALSRIAGVGDNIAPLGVGFYGNLAIMSDRSRNRVDPAVALRIKRKGGKGRIKREGTRRDLFIAAAVKERVDGGSTVQDATEELAGEFAKADRVMREAGLSGFGVTSTSAVRKIWEKHCRRDLTPEGLGLKMSTSYSDLVAELRQLPPQPQKTVSIFTVQASNNAPIFCALVPTK